MPLAATRTFTASDTANVATVLDNPLWYAAKYGSEDNEGLAEGVPSPNYFLVTNAGKLQQQLEDAFTRIIMLTKATSASAAASSTRTKGDTLIYQAKFDSSDWSGELSAFRLFDDVEANDPEWDAADLMPTWNERQIYTWNAVPDDSDDEPTGIPFAWSSTPPALALNTAQKASLSNSENLLNWLRGDQSLEGDTGFRARTKILGDIVHSDPLYVGTPQNVGYSGLPEGTPGADTYSLFLATNDGDINEGGTDPGRRPMIYVGANDGMLHAFDALTGAEKFAYVPNAVFPNLAALASTNYQHRYFVDGSPYVGDAYVNDAWRSILIGTLGAGGKAVFALDVTDPLHFAADDVLWEFTDTDLGYMVGQMTSSPVIGRLQNGQWAAIFGNGYDSGTGAWLYIVDLADGSIIKKIQVSADASNGLSAVVLIRDSEQTIAGAYAGDLNGNLWKFDLTGSTVADWDVAYSGAPLFQALDDEDQPQPQPITGPLDVGANPLGGYLIYFGTGQYMRATDPVDQSVQTAYGIWDNAILTKDTSDPPKTIWQGGTAITTGRDSLLEQNILFERGVANDLTGYSWRVISKNSIDWGTLAEPTDRGWFMDLVSPVAVGQVASIGEKGERIVSRPQILSGSGLVLFTSIVPIESDDPCVVGGGGSWVFAVDMFSGGRSEGATFDVNNDDLFNEADMTTVTIGEERVSVPLSGFNLTQIIDSPRVLLNGDDYTLVTAGSDGGDAAESPGVSGGLIGRQGWRQLR